MIVTINMLIKTENYLSIKNIINGIIIFRLKKEVLEVIEFILFSQILYRVWSNTILQFFFFGCFIGNVQTILCSNKNPRVIIKNKCTLNATTSKFDCILNKNLFSLTINDINTGIGLKYRQQ